MKKIVIFTLTIAAIVQIFNIILIPPAQAAVSAKNNFYNGLNNTAVGTGHDQPTLKQDLPVTIGVIIKSILGLVGIFFLLLMIYGGYLWMTGGGNEQQITKAKSIIQNALIGLIIIFAAYTITAIVMNNFSSVAN